MPIYRCKQCSLVAEDTSTPVGEKVGCAQCGTPSMVYGTVFYVEKLLERYFAALRENKGRKAPEAPEPPAPATPYKPTPPLAAARIGMDNRQTAPLTAWFAERQIGVRFEPAHVDMHGFFDGAARQIGAQFSLFAELIERIAYAYRNSHTLVRLELGGLPAHDVQAITALCQRLYERSFFARYHLQKPEKCIGLTLRPSQAIHQFFDGGWLQRLVFLRLQDLFKDQAPGLACARGATLVWADGDLHPLDVLILPQGRAPICIACKTGEVRSDIEPSLRLRQRLGLDRNRVILCAAQLSDAHTAGLSALHELSFVNLASLVPHVASLR
ncbi:hypothetical protein [Rhodoferax sp. WC2427]|uniref:hypothetical protein n=1 Tax=Rhodoferax sp. WC2427 TaxID=3234144 RepID=UPI0034660EF2